MTVTANGVWELQSYDAAFSPIKYSPTFFAYTCRELRLRMSVLEYHIAAEFLFRTTAAASEHDKLVSCAVL